MNIAMEQTEEYVNGQLKNKYGDAFIRGNNGEIHFPFLSLAVTLAVTEPLCSTQMPYLHIMAPVPAPVAISVAVPVTLILTATAAGTVTVTDCDCYTACDCDCDCDCKCACDCPCDCDQDCIRVYEGDCNLGRSAVPVKCLSGLSTDTCDSCKVLLVFTGTVLSACSLVHQYNKGSYGGRCVMRGTAPGETGSASLSIVHQYNKGSNRGRCVMGGTAHGANGARFTCSTVHQYCTTRGT